MLISRRQKAIIRNICKAQEKSFLRILKKKVKVIQEEMAKEGYAVKESDILEQISHELQQWDKTRDNPEQFVNMLDEKNIGMIKHYLVNGYLENPDSQPIWAKLQLHERANENPN